jgi:hypothetical protein
MFVLAASLVACSSTDEFASGDAFRKGLPKEEVLLIQTQTLSQTQNALTESGLATLEQKVLDERSQLHDLSFAVGFQINRHVRNILETIWFITRFEPNEVVEEDGVAGEGEDSFAYNARAVWGPFNDDEGKNLEFALIVLRGEDPNDGREVFIYGVQGRPQGSGDDAWVQFLLGGSKPKEPGLPDGFGLVKLDMNAMGQLDPNEDDIGVMNFIYHNTDEGHMVAAAFEGVWDEALQTTIDPTYFYGHSTQGYTVLQFETKINAEEPPGDLLEDLSVTTGWYQKDQGRSDAVVSGGDLGEAVATWTQCFGSDLKNDYEAYSAENANPPVAIEVGDVQACFIDQPIQIPEINYQDIRTAFE